MTPIEKLEGEMPDNYSRHEILHMASFLANAIDEELVENEAINEDPEWLALATQAVNTLALLYQKISKRHFELRPLRHRDHPE